MAKAFDTFWIDGLLYKLTLLNFPSYIVQTISSHLRDRTFEASFQTATSSRRGMGAEVAQEGLITPALFSQYVNEMPPYSHHVELALYADDTAIIATSLKPTLFVSYLESFFNDLERRLCEWWIATVSTSIAIMFARAGRRFIQPLPVTPFGEPIEWVYTTRDLVVTLNTRLTWSPHIPRSGRGLFNGWVCWAPFWIGRVICQERSPLYKQVIRTMLTPSVGPLPAPMSRGYRCYNPSVFASLLVPLGM